MTIIAAASAVSSATPAAFFDRWADMPTWPEWNTDTEWVRLNGPFRTGATGTLKPKGGPKVRFVVERLIDGREFVDVSSLPGARLVFAHLVSIVPDGTQVDVTITLAGPLRWMWDRIMGAGLRASAQRDLDALVAVAEAGTRADLAP